MTRPLQDIHLPVPLPLRCFTVAMRFGWCAVFPSNRVWSSVQKVQSWSHLTIEPFAKWHQNLLCISLNNVNETSFLPPCHTGQLCVKTCNSFKVAIGLLVAFLISLFLGHPVWRDDTIEESVDGAKCLPRLSNTLNGTRV